MLAFHRDRFEKVQVQRRLSRCRTRVKAVEGGLGFLSSVLNVLQILMDDLQLQVHDCMRSFGVYEWDDVA